ncbi:SusE domain-containing protein [Gelidibacter japonicus]|uniref:SusE domain-containing protein n=1 Tax=Gelidibacter japonicus TaxID=1962232 RepID=UPI0013D3F135|nr:SusE domain-containing protein [Gelidibacter japonicus]
MKKIAFSILFCTIFLGCSTGGDSDPDLPKNIAPTIPTLSSPSNTLLCVNNILEFKWEASSDGNGDAITYKIEISKDNQFTSISKTATVSGTTMTFTLERGVAYYWRVEAIDSKNESSGFSKVFSLYTEGDGATNYLPYAPQLIKPELSASIEVTTATLEWLGSDVDDDPLTYDIYFDENNPPTTLVSENQVVQTFEVLLAPNKTYYWKVIVKDNKEGRTIGQVWNFSTH